MLLFLFPNIASGGAETQGYQFIFAHEQQTFKAQEK